MGGLDLGLFAGGILTPLNFLLSFSRLLVFFRAREGDRLDDTGLRVPSYSKPLGHKWFSTCQSCPWSSFPCVAHLLWCVASYPDSIQSIK